VTDENRLRNVQLEMEKAEEARRDVEWLLQGGRWSAAASKAYYGMFYLARALVYCLGMEARTHEGLVHLISLHLVRPGHFPASMVREFSIMQALRETADYRSAVVVTEEDAREAHQALSTFRAAAEECLRERGCLPR
jgi:uncharacterized protein (UPF0332 family)